MNAIVGALALSAFSLDVVLADGAVDPQIVLLLTMAPE